MNFGMIGCKTIAAMHKGALAAIPDACLAGVFDANPAQAAAFAAGTDAIVFSSLEEMLASNAIDAVCICTPSGLHAQQAIQAANAKKHIVLEKPIGIVSKELREIERACEENGVVLTAISQMSFSDDFMKLKELVKIGALGDMLLCDLSMKYYRSAEYFRDGGWRGTKAMDGGGALMNQGIHGISLMLQLMGDVKSVTAYARTLLHDIEVEDTVVAILEFKSGALGNVLAATSVQPSQARVMQLHGSKGTAVLTEDVLSKLRLEGEPDYDVTQTKPLIFSSELHKRQIQDFMSAIAQSRKPLLDVTSGIKPVELILAIYSSSQTGKTICFDT